jgi:hypothetical protein
MTVITPASEYTGPDEVEPARVALRMDRLTRYYNGDELQHPRGAGSSETKIQTSQREAV